MITEDTLSTKIHSTFAICDTKNKTTTTTLWPQGKPNESNVSHFIAANLRDI